MATDITTVAGIGGVTSGIVVIDHMAAGIVVHAVGMAPIMAVLAVVVTTIAAVTAKSA